MAGRCRIIVALGLLLPLGMLAQAVEPSPVEERPRYKSPLGLAIDPTNAYAYVALHGVDALGVIDLRNDEVVCEIPVGRKPFDVALHRHIAYVSCEADDSLVAVDVKAQRVQRVVKVGQSPRGVAVDPRTGLISVVCHDDKTLWTLHPDKGGTKVEPIPPQPEGNYARARNLELVRGERAYYRQISRPAGLFSHGDSIFNPRPPAGKSASLLEAIRHDGAFNPVFDFELSRTGMDLVAHTRARWFTPTVQAPEGRIFTTGFSFFLNTSRPAAMVLLDEPKKGYPDPTDVVLQLPPATAGKSTLPLPKDGPLDAHPLKGARVFISSGGADAVIVLDLHKAATHFQTTHPVGSPFGGSMIGGWGMSGFPMGNMTGSVPLGTAMPGSMNRGTPVMPGVGLPGLGVPGFPGVGPSGPGTPGGFGGGAPPPANGQLGGAIGGGAMGMSGGMMGMMGTGFGWQGGFFGLHEDLHASARYTLRQLATQANPRRMVLTPDGKTLVVSNHLADSLTLIDAHRLCVLRHIDLGGPEPDAARRGEVLFHSAKHTFQQQFSCASCHPGGGSDGLAWDTSEKPAGEHLNSRSLLGVRDTRPFGWKGESETLADRVKNTMRHVHKHKISDADAADVAAFLQTLDPPRPLPQPANAVPAVARGMTLFHGKANCVRCHRGSELTSPAPRAVIANGKNELVPFDVPSLRGVARTAPYLHDGRAMTLEAIFKQHNPRQQHGRAHLLSEAELADLVMYLRSL